MAKLIVVCGPQAVGKMTVAESLRDKLNCNMMTNHDSIEVSDRMFGFGTPPQKEFNAYFREKAFEIAIKYDMDFIFTYVCAFEMPEERAYLTRLESLFKEAGGEFYFVELSATLETRLERNVTPHRLEMKPTKRNIEWSKTNLLRDTEKHRLNSEEGEVWFEHHLKIDNTNLSPDEVADLVIREYGFKRKDEK